MRKGRREAKVKTADLRRNLIETSVFSIKIFLLSRGRGSDSGKLKEDLNSIWARRKGRRRDIARLLLAPLQEKGNFSPFSPFLSLFLVWSERPIRGKWLDGTQQEPFPSLPSFLKVFFFWRFLRRENAPNGRKGEAHKFPMKFERMEGATWQICTVEK